MTVPRVSELRQRTERKWAPPTPLGNCRHCGQPVAMTSDGSLRHVEKGWGREAIGPMTCIVASNRRVACGLAEVAP